MEALFLFCRAGFEEECAREIREHAACLRIAGHSCAQPRCGRVVFLPGRAGDAQRLHRHAPVPDLTFARQAFVRLALIEDPGDNPAARLQQALVSVPGAVRGVLGESPDTQQGRRLAARAERLAAELERRLHASGQLRGGGELVVHVCLEDARTLQAGYALPRASVPWPGGVARLRRPRGAPSRSALKLDEALQLFLGPERREHLLKPGMTAVDLGAAPGGWTWQLARRRLQVTAVDNGPLNPGLAGDRHVRHLREDGFRFRPPRPVDWMVCDIADRPARVADRAARWIAGGWCRRSIFNLKLPMKRRYETAGRLVARVREQLDRSGVPCRVAAKQLYHDRAEITVFLERRGPGGPHSAARRRRSRPASRSRRRSSGSSRPA
ncbi:MAG TPA: 23S rRNA (cytidine(2498)-2'-O)-methyltransferase RlmM [Gammaproteobacteria bacterium]|nr:23S rRNA (cytidine(2498)-2'-O)-methyltransferase RlmM [Gammaproteobacteria bacterium]